MCGRPCVALMDGVEMWFICVIPWPILYSLQTQTARAESLYMLHESLISDVRLYGGGAYQDEKGHTYPMHSHQCWELVYYRQGSVVAQIDGSDYRAQAGVILLTPPGEAHSDFAETNYKNYFISLDIDANPSEIPRRFIDDNRGSMRNWCERVIYECAHDEGQRNEMLELLAQELRILLMRFIAREDPVDERMQQLHKMQAYMIEHLSETIRIADVAAHAHCAVSTMRDWFYKLHACSPQHYLMQLRVERARNLLVHSDMKLAAVADACGFDSVSHLSRVVKRFCSKSPGALRRTVYK